MMSKKNIFYNLIICFIILAFFLPLILVFAEDTNKSKEIKKAKTTEKSNIPSLDDNIIPYKEIETPTISIWKVISSTIIVVVLIIGLGYVFKILFAKSGTMYYVGKKMQVIDRLQISPTRQLLLISLSKKYIVISSTEKGVNFLTEFPKDKDEKELELEGGGENVEISESMESEMEEPGTEVGKENSFKNVLNRFTKGLRRIDKIVK